MRTRFPSLLTVLVFMVVGLAGCTSDGAGTDSVQTGDNGQPAFTLGANEGAISGLIVDDNYRPVQLKEEWGNSQPGDFQDVGFVLVQETGQRFETTENGEFTVLPLTPGTYTIRVAADNHEAISQTVQVVAGEYTEVTLEARRQYSDGGTVLSQEYVIFMSCSGAFNRVSVALAAVANNGCGDVSGDSGRFDFFTDFSPLNDIARGMVTELRAQDSGYYQTTIRTFLDGCDSTLGDCEYDEIIVNNGKYGKSVLYPGLHKLPSGEYLQEGQEGYCVAGVDSSADCPTYAFTFEHNFQTGLFADHPNRAITDPINDATEPVWGPYDGCCPTTTKPFPRGFGIILGIKAQFLQTVFLYELPEEGIEEFCALCEDADLPE